MSKSPEEEFGLPENASLSQTPPFLLISSQGSISISPSTSLHHDSSKSPKCLLVGRQASTADIRIQHKSISRKHALFYYINGELYLQDLGGKHGTTLNGQRVEGTSKLQHGDELYFGNVTTSTFIVKAPVTSESEMKESTTTETETVPQDDKEESPPPPPGHGLTGRAKREAEIAAMMASLDEKPKYQTYVPPPTAKQQQEEEEEKEVPRDLQMATKYSIPIQELFDVNIDSTSNDVRTKTSCMAIDPAGSRFAVGGLHLKLYDFAGMTSIQQDPFKTIEVQEGHVLVDVCYSNTGDRLIVATTSVQPKVLDRDGNEIIQFVRGDMYVTDQARTSGHTAGVTGVDWHPFHRDTVLTGSMDGSARLWNLNGKTQFDMLVCDKVYRAKNSKGQRVGVTAVAFHPGGREFVLGTACGSIQVWNATRVGTRPERVVYNAHEQAGRAINSLEYNVDGTQIVSRSSEDDTVKVWDARKLTRSCSPVATCRGLATVHERSNAIFSPDGSLVCAGTSEYEKGPDGGRIESGSLKIFLVKSGTSSKETTGSLLLELPAPSGVGVVAVNWHPKLNQILAACSDGRTCVYFDRSRSSKGAILASSKAGRGPDELTQLLASRAPQGSAAIAGEILTPHALPIFRQEKAESSKRKREKERLDPVKSRKPEAPATGKFKQGSQTGAAVSFSLFVANSSIQKNKIVAGRDPREELLKYQEGKNYASKAYEGDEPAPLEKKTLEEEEEELKK